jgi:UDP-glucose 4-epimerase
MDISDTRIVVIGGAGLIGSHIVEELLREPVREIVVFDNLTRGRADNLTTALSDSRVKLYEGDVLHTDVLNAALEGADAVFHLAALWLLHCHEFPRAAFAVNIEGTFNVIEACVRQHVRRLVYSSSASVYGDAVEVPMTEDHPYNNTTFYGATKIAGEHMCRAFHHRYNLDYVGLRYMNVYGPRQDYRGTYTSVIMKMLDRLDRNEPPVIYGDGSQAYDFIYVADTARANVCALKSMASDRYYNVGSGIRTSVRELCELLLNITGCKLQPEYLPAGPTFVTHRVGSTVLAERDLGFRSSTPLEEGIRHLIAWRNRQPGTRGYPV